MARLGGRDGRVYVGIANSAAAAEPIQFLESWSIDSSTDRQEVTAMGDASRVYIQGLPNATGSFSGFYDDASAQTYSAAVDGQARKLYIYPTTNNTAQYWFCTAFLDFSVQSGVNDAVKITTNWAAATAIQKVG